MTYKMQEETNGAKRIVLVTGGSRGLGEAFVRYFSNAGHEVYFTYERNQENANALVHAMNAAGAKVDAFQLDVRDEQMALKVVSQIDARSGGVGILINNAGVSHDGMSWKLPVEQFRNTVDINLTGSFIMSQAVLPGMRERRDGRILNISSVVAKRGIAGTSGYAASKCGLFGLTRTIAREVASRGITVNCLVAGYFDAGIGTKLPATIREQIIQSIPVGRFGDAARLAEIVAFLCSDACEYITGQEIVVDGGFMS